MLNENLKNVNLQNMSYLPRTEHAMQMSLEKNSCVDQLSYVMGIIRVNDSLCTIKLHVINCFVCVPINMKRWGAVCTPHPINKEKA